MKRIIACMLALLAATSFSLKLSAEEYAPIGNGSPAYFRSGNSSDYEIVFESGGSAKLVRTDLIKLEMVRTAASGEKKVHIADVTTLANRKISLYYEANDETRKKIKGMKDSEVRADVEAAAESLSEAYFFGSENIKAVASEIGSDVSSQRLRYFGSISMSFLKNKEAELNGNYSSGLITEKDYKYYTGIISVLKSSLEKNKVSAINELSIVETITLEGELEKVFKSSGTEKWENVLEAWGYSPYVHMTGLILTYDKSAVTGAIAIVGNPSASIKNSLEKGKVIAATYKGRSSVRLEMSKDIFSADKSVKGAMTVNDAYKPVVPIYIGIDKSAVKSSLKDTSVTSVTSTRIKTDGSLDKSKLGDDAKSMLGIMKEGGYPDKKITDAFNGGAYMIFMKSGGKVSLEDGKYLYKTEYISSVLFA